TLPLPYLVDRPLVTLNTPPIGSAMSSPSSTTLSSLAIARSSAEFIATAADIFSVSTAVAVCSVVITGPAPASCRRTRLRAADRHRAAAARHRTRTPRPPPTRPPARGRPAAPRRPALGR